MVSIENFYWVIQKNLLEPSAIDAWYYYPFGTYQNLSQFEFMMPESTRGHALFQFDQEPIIDPGLLYQHNKDSRRPWSNKYLKILANSEHSTLKKELCRRNDLLDWYFFYHGFASLDWFRDSIYINSDVEVSRPFISLNHITQNKRSYRMALLARMMDQGICNHGDISFHATSDQCKEEINDPNTELSEKDKDLIQKYLCNNSSLPLIIDRKDVNGDFSARFGINEFSVWQKSLLHVVNETIFYDQKYHLTEKVFKPIVCLRPFVLVAAPGNLAYLRRYGFKTFSPWIDESYDDVRDNDRRLDMIVSEITKFANMSLSQLRSMQKAMTPILEYNKHHFFNRFREIIVDEMIENFDTCLKIWNNGRIDDRKIDRHPDLESVKKILLR